MRLDVIIPLCDMFPRSTDERLHTLNFALRQFYAKQTGIKLRMIFVEQSLGAPVRYLPKIAALPGIEVVKVSIQHPVFNKGWCTNVGVKHVTSPVFMLAEADMFCVDNYLATAVAWMEETQSKWCFGWNDLYYTTKEEKRMLMAGLPLIRLGPGRRTRPKRRMAEGGFVLFDTQFFKDMGYANEWIQELGGPDNDLAERARYMTGYYRMFKQQVFHLWHERVPLKNRPTRQNNIYIIKLTRRNTSKVQVVLQAANPGQKEEPRCAIGPWDQIVRGYIRL